MRYSTRVRKSLARKTRSRRTKLRGEGLEVRHMLAAENPFAENLVAQFRGWIGPDQADERIPISIAPEHLSLGRDRANLRFQVEVLDASWNPAAVRILDSSGQATRATLARQDLPGTTDSLVIARLPAGDYTVVVSGQSGSKGKFGLSVGLVGDADGNHRVDRADGMRIRAAYGSLRGEDRYLPAADADGDGRIGSFDLAQWQLNSADTPQSVPVTTTLAVKPPGFIGPVEFETPVLVGGTEDRLPAVVPTAGYDPDAPMRFYESKIGWVQPLSTPSPEIVSGVFQVGAAGVVAAGMNAAALHANLPAGAAPSLSPFDIVFPVPGDANTLTRLDFTKEAQIAAFHNTLGYYVTNAKGEIEIKQSGGNIVTIPPTNWADYRAAVKAAEATGQRLLFTDAPADNPPNGADGKLTYKPTNEAFVGSGKFVAFYLKQDSMEDGNWWFSVDTANEDGFVHFQPTSPGDEGHRTDIPSFKVEDLSNSDTGRQYPFTYNDADYNDLVFSMGSVTGFRPDIDTDSNNDGTIDPENDPLTGTDDPIENDSAKPGRLVRLNSDDDDDNGVADLDDSDLVAREDDLVELIARDLGIQGWAGVGTFKVAYDKAIVQLYHGDDRSSPIGSGEHLSPDATIYAEGKGIGSTSVKWTFTVDGEEYFDEVHLTVAGIDVQLDGLAERYEQAPYSGAIVQRNSDFSKNNLAAGTETAIPDYERDGDFNQYFFDAEYERDYTPAIISWIGADPATTELVLTFDDTILVWTDPVVGVAQQLISGQPIVPPVVTGSMNLWIEGIKRSSGLGGNEVSLGIRPKGGTAAPQAKDEALYTVVELNAAVDGNRDGALSFTNEADRSILFWYNDDREGLHAVDYNGDDIPWGFGASYETDVAVVGGSDASDSVIELQRDLEDFAAWSIDVDPLLFSSAAPSMTYFAALDVAAGGLVINIFENTSTGDSKSHALDSVVGQAIVTDQSSALLHVATSDRTAQNTFGINVIQAGVNPFLFESSAVDTVADAIVFSAHVMYPDLRTKSLQTRVDLNLRRIDDFFDTYAVTPGEDFFDPSVASLADYEIQHASVVNDLPGSGFNNDEYTLFVHGWNMSPVDAQSFAATAFKRMYWEGYAGRFGVFEWPTFVEAHSPDSLPALTYNASEFNAFRSGTALAGLLTQLSADSDVKLVAHSMGNIVAGEALRELAISTGGQQVIDTYIAMEAAVAQSAYDPNGNADVGDLYANALGAGIFSGGVTSAGQWINIHNPNDYALDKWELNNLIKGNPPDFTATSLWPFRYDAGPFRRFDEDGNNPVALTLLNANGTLGPNGFEILAFFAHAAPNMTIGRNGDTLGPFTNINLNTLGYSNALPDWNGSPGHSFQFNYNSAQTHLFWQQIVTL